MSMLCDCQFHRANPAADCRLDPRRHVLKDMLNSSQLRHQMRLSYLSHTKWQQHRCLFGCTMSLTPM